MMRFTVALRRRFNSAASILFGSFAGFAAAFFLRGRLGGGFGFLGLRLAWRFNAHSSQSSKSPGLRSATRFSPSFGMT